MSLTATDILHDVMSVILSHGGVGTYSGLVRADRLPLGKD